MEKLPALLTLQQERNERKRKFELFIFQDFHKHVKRKIQQMKGLMKNLKQGRFNKFKRLK